MRLLRTLLPLCLTPVFALRAQVTAAPAPRPSAPMTTREWLVDLDTLVHRITATHPKPYRVQSRERFDAQVRALRADIPRLDSTRIAARFAMLVASLRDGHSRLDPYGRGGFKRWYPLRFYRFTDGVYITAADTARRVLLGARVVRIGRISADSAAALAATLMGADNSFGDWDHTMMLSSPEALLALSVASRTDSLALAVVTRDGRSLETSVPSVAVARPDMSWLTWGEMDTPAGTTGASVFGAGGRRAMYADSNPSLPLHVRGRQAYWYSYLPDQRTVFMQINAMANKSSYSKLPFVESYLEMFRFIDSSRVDRLIVDLRYNSGGNGELVDGFVHELIKRDTGVNRPGRLFVVSGRKTFSAGADLLGQITRHTAAIVVGEPAGVGPASSGDATNFTLPNSSFPVMLSTYFSRDRGASDTTAFMPVELPAPFTGEDYVSGRDPAIELILVSPAPLPTVIGLLKARGAVAADSLYRAQRARYGALSWWQPFRMTEVNDIGLTLLEQGKQVDALLVLQMNADQFNDSWYTWDSLGEGLAKTGQRDRAIAAYQKALALSPHNPFAASQKEWIAKLMRQP